MAARKSLLQLAIAAVNIIIAALVFTSIWPFPSGEIGIHLPSAHDVSWTYSNGMVHVVAPFSIDNGWIYDINDLTITYSVTNGSNSELAGQTYVVGDVPAGRITSSEIDFEFDLLANNASGIQWMVFHEDMLYFFIEVSCWYTMKLIQFEASYQVSVPWDALVQGYGISSYIYALGPPLSTTIGYWLNTSHLLSGLPPADVTLSYFGDDTLMGQSQTTIQLGGSYTGTIEMDIAPVIASSYVVVLEVQFSGFPIVYREVVSAPPGVIP